MKPITLTICMGSSCFSRGNNRNLPNIRKQIEENAYPVQIVLKGCRCGSNCSGGPNIWIDTEQCRDVTPATLPQFFQLLQRAVERRSIHPESQ